VIGHTEEVNPQSFLDQLGLSGAKSPEEEVPHGYHLPHPLFPQLSRCFPRAQFFEVAENFFTA
jgi:hypothetical protein